MLTRLLAFLRQPYPVPDGPGPQLRRAFWIGLFVGGFLTLFQPFGLNEWPTPHKPLKLAGFGLISALVTFGWYAAAPALAPNFFRENRWTVARAALFLNLNIGLIAVGNLLYLSWLLNVAPGRLHPDWMLAITFLIGLFPAAAVTTATYIRQLRRHQAGAAGLNRAGGPQPSFATLRTGSLLKERGSLDVSSAQVKVASLPSPLGEGPGVRPLTFTAENGKDTLTMPAAAVLYLEAADNYCTVAYLDAAGRPARALLRASLSRLAGQAAEQGAEQLRRVHRSYLVNLGRVTRVSGNAQGYRLHLPAGPDAEPVPVGRTYAEAVLAALRAAPVRP